MNPTKSQSLAIERFRAHVEQGLTSYDKKYGAKITGWGLEAGAGGSIWVRCEAELTALEPGNLLRAVSREYWFVLVGPKGRITVRMAPQSYHQFHGRRAHGMKFLVK